MCQCYYCIFSHSLQLIFAGFCKVISELSSKYTYIEGYILENCFLKTYLRMSKSLRRTSWLFSNVSLFISTWLIFHLTLSVYNHQSPSPILSNAIKSFNLMQFFFPSFISFSSKPTSRYLLTSLSIFCSQILANQY